MKSRVERPLCIVASGLFHARTHVRCNRPFDSSDAPTILHALRRVGPVDDARYGHDDLRRLASAQGGRSRMSGEWARRIRLAIMSAGLGAFAVAQTAGADSHVMAPIVVLRMASATWTATRRLRRPLIATRSLHSMRLVFLEGFSSPGSVFVSSKGVFPDALEEGQAFARAHPAQSDSIMRGYGYVLRSISGHCISGFENST
jgi:hypothetical protein